MNHWYMDVQTENGVESTPFYHSDENPLEEYPERFEFPFDDAEGYGDVTRDMVDKLEDGVDYWVIDTSNDVLREGFPLVPDVPPSEAKPTYFVAVPKDAVKAVYPKNRR